MTIEPLMIFWVLVILVFILAGQMMIALWVIYRLNRKLTEAKKREQRREETLAKKETEAMAEVQQQAKKIIAAAVRKAVKVEKTAADDKSELKQLLDRRLRRELEKVQKDNINVFKSISKGIEEDTQRAMLAAVEKQKEERLKKLDGEIVGLVEAVAEKVLGRVLSLETHEELIFEALEKAKKERIFR